jgi:peptidoglycan hydrolase FlgJ
VDLGTAERLISAADPKTVATLKNRRNDPVAAKAVAGQFAALLTENIMRRSDGAALPFAGDAAAGGNVVSSMFTSAISQVAASDGKLGLADMLFHSIEAKQQAAGGGGELTSPVPAAPGAAMRGRTPSSPRTPHGFSLQPYWQNNGLRPPAPAATQKSFGLRPVPGQNAWAAAPMAAGGMALLPSAGVSPGQAVSPRQVRTFARQLRPMLAAAGRQLGVSPKILLAHAALETGWGRSVVGNNLFGIKADPLWQGAQVTTLTHEVEDGAWVAREAAFRAYPSLDASVQDYVALIGGNPRYQGLIGSGDDVAAYGRGLVDGGYATDTDYGSKLEAIAAEAAAAFATPSNAAPGRLRLFATPEGIE